MFDLDRIEEIWITITRNKIRSFLTAFGVLWGIYMLTLMIGTGNGLKRGFVHGIDGFANNSCFLGAARTSLPYKGFQKGRNWFIHNKDLKILTDSIPEIECLSPILWTLASNVNNVVRGEQVGSFAIRGIYPNYASVERQHLAHGRFINEIDIAQKRKVCVIGTKVYEELFPLNENPLEKEIRVHGIYYKIIGVTYGISDISVGAKLEDSVLLPLTTLQQINNVGNVIHALAVTSAHRFSVSKVEQRIKEVLKSTYTIHPEDFSAVWSINLEEEFNLFQNLFAGIDILIWIIGSGTLIAGIVGVCNIMLVTVRERTREIGIKRALGANPLTIITQILIESLFLTSIAGLPGLCIGVYTLFLADKYWLQNLDNVFFYKPMITFDAAVVSIIILVVSGLLAGLIPASRALRIKAIDAIREE
jgi:putative ABC transport system permease protein